MDSAEDKHWAQRALIDPLNEPEPSEETGPGTSFRPSSTISASSSPSSPSSGKLQKSNNPYRKSSASSKNPFVAASEISGNENHRRSPSYPSPPHSASPRRDQFSHRQQAFGGYSDAPPSPQNGERSGERSSGRRRTSSLTERYPGDKSHRPLDMIKQEDKLANRAPHLRKKHQIRPDIVDSLDQVTSPYHHEGPFDATYLARNTSWKSSPLEAVAASNEEALKATPREKIVDAVERHRPLDGVAAYPPGEVDRNGQVYRYEPGENLMIEGNPEGGAYKRYPGIQYHPDDIKGKGEPSYSIEKAIKEHKHSNHRRELSEGIEMTSRPRSQGHNQDMSTHEMWGDGEVPNGNMGRSNTTGKQEKRLSGGNIRKRFGSIRRSLGGKKDFE